MGSLQSRIARHLGPVLSDPSSRAFFRGFDRAPAPDAEVEPSFPPEEFNGRDYAIFLLRVAAEIEHSLMVQYLFAAYSLGGPNVPDAVQSDVRAWQETIFGIAKEEMAHLVTVQNLLTALGGPLNFNRQDYPYDTDFYPFGFKLQPLSLSSLAAYVCAESPPDWEGPEAEEIKDLANAATGATVNRVGNLYAVITRLLSDQTLIPDDSFDGETLSFQASWNEWGRGYREGQRGGGAMAGLPGLPAPQLVILRVASRADAIAALRVVGEQGEGFETPPEENESHFERFLAIYRAMKDIGEGAREVVRPVAMNPTTQEQDAGGDASDPETSTEITHFQARLWAHLFNVRYRKLLISLAHAFELSEESTDRVLTSRGSLIHRTFSEMYHLRTLAGRLVNLPVGEGDPEGPRAGPPFQMPYSLALPFSERDRWRGHRDLLDASLRLVDRLEAENISQSARNYLESLRELDGMERAQVELLIVGSGRLPNAPVPTP